LAPAWEHVVPFFAFAPGICKMIYITNAVETLHRSLRKIIKTRGSFPNDDGVEAALPGHQECRLAVAASG
jgi:transposase-like protein